MSTSTGTPSRLAQLVTKCADIEQRRVGGRVDQEIQVTTVEYPDRATRSRIHARCGRGEIRPRAGWRRIAAKASDGFIRCFSSDMRDLILVPRVALQLAARADPAHSPVNRGDRFSPNALRPSSASALVRTSDCTSGDPATELRFVARMLALIDQLARGDEGARGALGQSRCQCHRAVHQPVVVEDLAHDAQACACSAVTGSFGGGPMSSARAGGPPGAAAARSSRGRAPVRCG